MLAITAPAVGLWLLVCHFAFPNLEVVGIETEAACERIDVALLSAFGREGALLTDVPQQTTHLILERESRAPSVPSSCRTLITAKHQPKGFRLQSRHSFVDMDGRDVGYKLCTR